MDSAKKSRSIQPRCEGGGLGGFSVRRRFRSDGREIKLDLVCASKRGVSPLIAGERVVGHIHLGPRRHCDVVDVLS